MQKSLIAVTGQIEKQLLFEVRAKGQDYKIFTNGEVEGLGGEDVIVVITSML